MIGIELDREGAGVVQHCLENRLLVNCTQGNVIRLLPAMNLTDDLFDEGCAILENALLTLGEQR
jgi:acetylornithine/N-succinyldiaminopimelate aminotransferase